MSSYMSPICNYKLVHKIDDYLSWLVMQTFNHLDDFILSSSGSVDYDSEQNHGVQNTYSSDSYTPETINISLQCSICHQRHQIILYSIRVVQLWLCRCTITLWVPACCISTRRLF
jgi:hypothetical protein